MRLSEALIFHMPKPEVGRNQWPMAKVFEVLKTVVGMFKASR